MYIKKEGDRWIWFDADITGGVLKRIDVSLITFPTEEDARRDVDATVSAAVDETKRLVRPKADIDWLIATAMGEHDVCAGAEFGPAYWHERDSSGANWNVRVISGEGWGPCLNAMTSTIYALRQVYSIPDER